MAVQKRNKNNKNMGNVIPKVEKVADVGTNEPFVACIVMGLSELLDVDDF